MFILGVVLAAICIAVVAGVVVLGMGGLGTFLTGPFSTWGPTKGANVSQESDITS